MAKELSEARESGKLSITEMMAKTPDQIAKDAHSGYYASGDYSDDRYAWTVQTFLPACTEKKILEVGCGSGKLLSLLKSQNEYFGVDAAADGIIPCPSRAIHAYSLVVSLAPSPFPTRPSH